jgi:hypothetical protein
VRSYFGEFLTQVVTRNFGRKEPHMINKKTMKIIPDLYDTRTWKEAESVEITCDICSVSCENIEATEAWSGDRKFHDYVELKASWGYFSDYDGENWEAHVCTKCIKQHLFPLIKFNVRDYMYGNVEIGTRVNGKMEYIEKDKTADPYEL